MPSYKITVKRVVPFLTNSEDEAAWGNELKKVFSYTAEDELVALDNFNSEVKIGCLEDFDVSVSED